MTDEQHHSKTINEQFCVELAEKWHYNSTYHSYREISKHKNIMAYLRELVMGGFTWEFTKEGDYFWSKLYSNIFYYYRK